MTLLKYLTFNTLLLIISSTAYAKIEIRFIEGAPKDEFIIQNIGECSLKQFVLDIDLSSSAGNLFFDTSDQGQGVEVPQPFEATRGQFELISQNKGNKVLDGENSLSLKIAELKPKQLISFTIDVDDKLENSQLGQIQVTGSEIEGTSARINTMQKKSISAAFGKNNKSIIILPSCA